MLLLLSTFSLLSLVAGQIRVGRQPPPVYNSSLYWNVDTGPVHSTDILTCRFESDCCWSSTISSSKWYHLKEQRANEALIQTFNLTDRSQVPSGNHLATILAVRDNKRSIFRSCSFCAQRKITVNFSYWITPFVTLQVCWHDAFFENQLEHELDGQPFVSSHCRTVDPRNMPGPTRVDFVVPTATIVEIVFVVSNKRGSFGGGMVILDDLSVGGRLCGENRRPKKLRTTTAPPATRRDTPAPDPFEQLFGRDFAHFLDADFTTLNEDVGGPSTSPRTPTSLTEARAKLANIVRLIKVKDVKGNSTNFTPRTPASASNRPSTFRGSPRLLGSLRPPVAVSFGENLQKLPANPPPPRSLGTNSPNRNIRKPCATPGSCTFEFGACNYTNSRAIRSKTLFRVFTADADEVRHSFGVAGISSAAEGKKYIRADTKGGDMAVLEVDINFQEDMEVAFDVYESSSGQQLSACCFTPNRLPQPLLCPFNTNPGVSAGDRRWQTANFTCHKGATKIVFMCENYGRFLGVCALDDIQLYRKTATGLKFRCD